MQSTAPVPWFPYAYFSAQLGASAERNTTAVKFAVSVQPCLELVN